MLRARLLLEEVKISHPNTDPALASSKAEPPLGSDIPKAGPSSGLNLCSEEGIGVLVWFSITGFLQSPLKSREKLPLTQVRSDPDTEHKA